MKLEMKEASCFIKRGVIFIITPYFLECCILFLISGCISSSFPIREEKTSAYNVERRGKESFPVRYSEVEDINRLIQKLKNQNPRIQKQAMQALSEIGMPAVEPLIAVLKDKSNGDIHWDAAILLREIGAPAVDSLITLLKDGDEHIQVISGWILENIGAPAVAPLIALQKDENINVRKAAAAALAEIKDARAVVPLIVALKDKNGGIQWEAAKALGNIGAPAVEPLIAVLSDKNIDVRRPAVSALSKTKDMRAVEPLIVALADKDADVRTIAAEGLAEIKDSRAVEPLIATTKDEKEYVRKEAVRALAQIKDTRAVEFLIAVFKDKDLEAVAAAYPFFIRRGEAGTENTLIEAFNKYGTREMAGDFLNCGNIQLKEAACKWSDRHSLIIGSLNMKIVPKWGEGIKD